MRPPALLIPLLPLALLLVPMPATAAIFKCVDAGGGVTYSGRPCPEETVSVELIEVRGGGTAARSRPPVSARPDDGDAERDGGRFDERVEREDRRDEPLEPDERRR